MSCDVTDAESVQAAVAATVARFGRLDVLYNNAGVSLADDDGAVSTPESTWDTTMDVNVKGVWLGCRYGIPAMLDSGGGSIINVASFVAHLGAADPAARLHHLEGRGAGDDPGDRGDPRP